MYLLWFVLFLLKLSCDWMIPDSGWSFWSMNCDFGSLKNKQKIKIVRINGSNNNVLHIGGGQAYFLEPFLFFSERK